MKLNIEVSEPNAVQRQHLHSIVIEDEVTDDQVDVYQAAFEVHPDVSVCFAPVRPGDDIYGVIAEFVMLMFFAQRDMSREIEDIMDEAWAEAAGV